MRSEIRYGKRWYRPREIARQRLIVNSTGHDNEDSNYAYVLMLIRTKRLRAKDYSNSPRIHYWLVPEDEVARYHDTVTRVE
jgi:hypothetical protein